LAVKYDVTIEYFGLGKEVATTLVDSGNDGLVTLLNNHLNLASPVVALDKPQLITGGTGLNAEQVTVKMEEAPNATNISAYYYIIIHYSGLDKEAVQKLVDNGTNPLLKELEKNLNLASLPEVVDQKIVVVPEDKDGDKANDGALIGGIIGGLVGAIGLIVLIVGVIRWYIGDRDGADKKVVDNDNVQMDTFEA